MCANCCFQPGLKDPRFSRRLKAYDELRNNISQHTIKMDFLNRVHRYTHFLKVNAQKFA